MNYEDRKRMVAEWINPDSGYLRRFKAPAVDGLADELVELVEAINSAAPLMPSPEAFSEFLAALGKRVANKAKTRSWPLQSEFISAIDDIRKRSAPALTADAPDAQMDAKIHFCTDWLSRQDQLPEWWRKDRALLSELVKRRIFSEDELRGAGGDIPTGNRIAAERMAGLIA